MSKNMQANQFFFGTNILNDSIMFYGHMAKPFNNLVSQSSEQWKLFFRSIILQSQKIRSEHTHHSVKLTENTLNLTNYLPFLNITTSWVEYFKDASDRIILTIDVLRERGDVFIEHEAAGCPPVLVYDYEVIVDGAKLKRPCNYQLLRIKPPKGVDVNASFRPYIIVDPRAGHGGGIGGFKPDSQVGVALAKSHPVYFVSFGRDPLPEQTLADVMYAEAEFVREVCQRHPNSPQPVVIGNCQGGWAILLMAACNPDIKGPLVLNGAPIAPWSGEVGENPMRYNAGVLGGTWQPMLWSDLGGGQFDGANLVMNFEQLNPSRNYFGKYYDLYRDPEGGRQRFIDFERWWGGFFILNEAEIHWIVEQLFVGNCLVKNTAQLEPGIPVDIKAVTAPVFVFASHGDNITPPQQALNWIAATYSGEQEIRVRGQRIIYMLHDDVGHLGIFVSSKVARKETTSLTSILEIVEAMAPGLYEMQIGKIEGEGIEKQFEVRLIERTLEDVAALDDGQKDEDSFAAVAYVSDIQTSIYEATLRPIIRSLVTPSMANIVRTMHPLRTQRKAFSSQSPFVVGIKDWAEKVKNQHNQTINDNFFVQLETLMAKWFEQNIDTWRDIRDACYEATFYWLWGNPFTIGLANKSTKSRKLLNPNRLRHLPEVNAILSHIEQGGIAEAVVRMLVLLADAHQSFRAEILDRWAYIFTHEKPFSNMSVEQRQRVLHEQTINASFEAEKAIHSLPKLLPSQEERHQAIMLVERIIGDVQTPSKELITMAKELCQTLAIECEQTDAPFD
ncbi:DUF3141 domain-containing protein [Marinibactrum halimedae]|uniref:3-hydroxyalkanoate synthetase n=1 Tax=Marinibactrum halimedae TaxID=1444977 RepID=A0AA37T591_9GAMM|nr:DUF3141 domain-containing protein [Marinibactrum halimedae]MCD9460284.1 DUF3141 domain-containing protein [Marinibactrum halimedae]GLS24371.1 3-hydroxyalkanoate synthetase [Marinibactrum halimedae]